MPFLLGPFIFPFAKEQPLGCGVVDVTTVIEGVVDAPEVDVPDVVDVVLPVEVTSGVVASCFTHKIAGLSCFFLH